MTLTSSFPLTTGSPGNGTYLCLRYGKDTDVLAFAQFFFKMKPDSLMDIYHQLIESLSLSENVNADAPAAPEFAIRIDFKFNEHESTTVIWVLYSSP
jgi:hypothetical protein